VVKHNSRLACAMDLGSGKIKKESLKLQAPSLTVTEG